MSRKVLLFVAAFLSSMIIFSSCGSDEDIVGTWRIVTETYTECQENGDNGIETYSSVPCTAEGPDDCVYTEVAFTESTFGSTTYSNFFNAVDTFSISGVPYTIDGDKLTICVAANNCVEGTFTVSGDNMTLVGLADPSDPDDTCILTTEFVRI